MGEYNYKNTYDINKGFKKKLTNTALQIEIKNVK